MGAPLPGVIYPPGTMSAADIYPTHAGIGGITTQNRALPAFADSVQQQVQATTAGQAVGMLGTPAGYLVLLALALVVGAWVLQ